MIDKSPPPPPKITSQDIRVVQKNLLYIFGIGPRWATENQLRTLCSQFGRIEKVKISENREYKGVRKHCLSAHVLYASEEDAFLALKCLPQIHKELRVQYGTSKYCQHFLAGRICPKGKHCIFLHERKSEELRRIEVVRNNISSDYLARNKTDEDEDYRMSLINHLSPLEDNATEIYEELKTFPINIIIPNL
ncbi:MAG: CCR4-NOT transcription complex subunit 4 [Marteilia pararefringens]